MGTDIFNRIVLPTDIEDGGEYAITKVEYLTLARADIGSFSPLSPIQACFRDPHPQRPAHRQHL